MHSCEDVLTVVQIIVPFTDVEVQDADRINLFHLIIAFTKGDMFCDRFCYSIENAFQIIELTGVLNLYNDNLILAVTCFDVYTVELIITGLLITFAFQ